MGMGCRDTRDHDSPKRIWRNRATVSPPKKEDIAQNADQERASLASNLVTKTTDCILQLLANGRPRRHFSGRSWRDMELDTMHEIRQVCLSFSAATSLI